MSRNWPKVASTGTAGASRRRVRHQGARLKFFLMAAQHSW
jgi:hypothetical protein